MHKLYNGQMDQLRIRFTLPEKAGQKVLLIFHSNFHPNRNKF